LLADKAYDANAVIDTLAERGITLVIPAKANRIVQRPRRFRPLSRTRPRRALFFDKLKGFRAIATRGDKLAGTFLAAIQLVSALFWIC
jgi:transposase